MASGRAQPAAIARVATQTGNSSHQTRCGSAGSDSRRWLSHRLAAQTVVASRAPATMSDGQCTPR